MKLTKNSFKETFLFSWSVFLVVLLMATVKFNSPILLWALVGSSTLLLFQPIYLLPVYLISSLSTTYFVAGQDLGISRLIGFILIAAGLIYNLTNNYSYNVKNIILIAILFFYTLFSSIFSLTSSYVTFISFSQFLIVVILLSQIRNVNLEKLSKLLTLSAIITLIIIAFELKSNLISMQVQRLSTGENVNENRFAMMLEQLTAIIYAAFFVFSKNKIIRFIVVPIILLAFFMLILSGSRSATIGIMGAIIVSQLYHVKTNPKKYILPLFFLVILGYLFILTVHKMNIPVIDRFSVESVKESGGTHRLEVWQTLVPITLKNEPLFGFGFGGGNSIALAYKNGLMYAPHNFFFEMLIQVGIVGMFIFLYYFVFIARELLKATQNPIVFFPIILLLSAFFNGIGETIYVEKLFWNGIGLAWLYLNNLPPILLKKNDTITSSYEQV